MASTVQVRIGTLASEAVPLGAATDAVIGAKIKEWATGSGVALPTDTNKQVADKTAAWLAARFREHVKAWHVATARTAFEESSGAAGDNFLDVT